MEHLNFPSAPVDPCPETMRELGYELVDRIVEHLATLNDQPVVVPGTSAELASLVDEPLPLDRGDPADCMAFVFDRVVPQMTRVNHPRFHAYIPSPSSFIGAIGEMLAAGLNPFVGTWLGGATLSALELTVIRWIAELLGYDSQTAGILTSGGSIANLIALAAARERLGEDALGRGKIYVSKEGHASVNKAAATLGFPRNAIRTIETDGGCRMATAELIAALQSDLQDGFSPCFVCANAGTTNTGAIDPLNDLADVCAQFGVWYHIDAAYGGFAAISPQIRTRFAGLERADSVTLDPHKWLLCPIGIGCVLVRDRKHLEHAFNTTGDYLKDLPPHEVNFMDRGPELSRPARVLPVWMVIRSLGRNALAEQVDRDIRLAQLAAELLQQANIFEVLPPELSVVAFRHRGRPGESETARGRRDDGLMRSILDCGELMISTTRVRGQNTLRFVVMNHRTTESDVRRSVAKILELAEP